MVAWHLAWVTDGVGKAKPDTVAKLKGQRKSRKSAELLGQNLSSLESLPLQDLCLLSFTTNILSATILHKLSSMLRPI